VVDWIADTYNVQPVLIAMEALDERACNDLKKTMKNSSIFVNCAEYGGDAMAAFLRTLTVLITTRYHGMLLSMPGCVPFIGLSRDERIRGVMKEIGLFNDYYVDYLDPNLEEKLKERAKKLMDSEQERKRLSNVIRENIPYYFAQMALLGVDIRRIVKRYYPSFNPVDIDENNAAKLIPYVPPDYADGIKKKFLELKAAEEKAGRI